MMEGVEQEEEEEEGLMMGSGVFAPRDIAASIGWTARSSAGEERTVVCSSGSSNNRYDDPKATSSTSQYKAKAKANGQRNKLQSKEHTKHKKYSNSSPAASVSQTATSSKDQTLPPSLLGQQDTTLAKRSRTAPSSSSSSIDQTAPSPHQLDHTLTPAAPPNDPMDCTQLKNADVPSFCGSSTQEETTIISPGVTINQNTTLYQTVTMEPDSEIAITGRAYFELLQGGVEILGYTATATATTTQQPMYINCPDCMGAFLIQNPSFDTATNDATFSNYKNTTNGETRGSCVFKISSVPSDTTTPYSDKHKTELKDESTNGPIEHCIAKEKTFQLSPRRDVRNVISIPQEWISTTTDIISSLHYADDDDEHAIVNLKGTNHVDGSFDWQDGSIAVSNNLPTPHHQHPMENDSSKIVGKHDSNKILVCGAKGVGKSTYLRYLVHRLFSSHQQVAVLDCDVGQPELSPPGMVSLTVLHKNTPLWSPPHAHMVIRDGSSIEQLSYYYGHVTSKADPVSYTAAISYLMSDYHRSHENMTPLVINTNGWVKGMGYEILSSLIVDVVRPGHVVQILGSTRSKFFDLIPLVPFVDDYCQFHVVETFGRNDDFSSIYGNNNNNTTGNENYYGNGAGDGICHGNGNGETFRGFLEDRKGVFDDNGGLMVGKGDNNTTTSAPRFLSNVVSPFQRNIAFSVQRMQNAYNVAFANQATFPYDSSHVPMMMMTSSVLRTVRLCSYFLGGYEALLRATGAELKQCGIVDENNGIASALADQKPCVVPLEAVECTVFNGQDFVSHQYEEDAKYLFDALNGSVVGLCCCKSNHRDDGAIERNSPNSDGIEKPPPYPCVGLGIVRSIDRHRKLLFILTPVSANLLKSVNVLVKGQVQLPLECVFRGIFSESFPYQCCDGISAGIGNDIMKSKNMAVKK